MMTGIRTIDEPDWAPIGGTSSNRHREIREPLAAAFQAGLRERVDQLGEQAWVRIYDDHVGPGVSDPWASVCIGWTDDEGGGYYVGYGLEHNPYLPAADQRWFLWLQYRTEDATRDERIGDMWINPPYATDTELHLDLLLAWFQAHRRRTRPSQG